MKIIKLKIIFMNLLKLRNIVYKKKIKDNNLTEIVIF
jgi:hypothetical protein